MALNLDGQLVVAISSRALFDLEEENRVFEESDDPAYMKLQLDHKTKSLGALGQMEALDWPLVQSAARFLREMASFASAGVSHKQP